MHVYTEYLCGSVLGRMHKTCIGVWHYMWGACCMPVCVCLSVVCVLFVCWYVCLLCVVL